MSSEEYAALIFADSDHPISSIFTTEEITEAMENQVRKDYIPVQKIERVDQGYHVTRTNGTVEFHPFVNTVKAVKELPEMEDEE